MKGWEALVRAVRPDGRLGWVQQIGAEPGSAGADSTEVYGSGRVPAGRERPFTPSPR